MKNNIYDEPVSTKVEKHQDSIKSNMDSYLSRLFSEMEYGVNLENGVLFINSDIEDFVFYEVVAKINLILQYRKYEKLNETSPLSIIINSGGGSVYAALAIIDYIQSLNIPVNTICRGRAMSAAALILTCGTGTRAASKNSTIMFHEISTDFFGKSSDVKQSVKHLEVLEDSFLTLLEKASKKSKEWWKDNCIRDTYFEPSEALNLGIIDSII
jgi:ATP-dependent Clp protease protease subunit